ncbi:MAG: hypothetical protein JW951_06980, partial [Lentisphaerae bacterium]|nr:hypothetical protein [Lentisphaerota bacterium]
VRDDRFVQPFEDTWTWNGDSLQVGFNLDLGSVRVETGNTVADAGTRARWSILNLALTEAGPQCWRGRSYDPETLPLGLIPAGRVALSVVCRDDQTQVYEAAIPWTVLGARPDELVKSTGLAISFNDRDDADKTVQHDPSALGLYDGIQPWDPDAFGWLLLERP